MAVDQRARQRGQVLYQPLVYLRTRTPNQVSTHRRKAGRVGVFANNDSVAKIRENGFSLLKIEPSEQQDALWQVYFTIGYDFFTLHSVPDRLDAKPFLDVEPSTLIFEKVEDSAPALVRRTARSEITLDDGLTSDSSDGSANPEDFQSDTDPEEIPPEALIASGTERGFWDPDADGRAIRNGGPPEPLEWRQAAAP